MTRPILVVHPSGRAQRALARMLASVQRPVFLAAGLSEARQHLSASPELVLMSHEAYQSPDGLLLLEDAARAGASSFLALLGADAGASEIGRLFRTAVFSHFLLEDLPSLGDVVGVTVLKLLRHDLFGIEKYLAWGVEPTRRTLARAGERRTLIIELREDLLRQGLGPRFASMASHIAAELLSNAAFHAPLDSGGRHIYSDASRSEDFPLERPAELAYACDGRFLAIAVTDRHGSLARDAILASLLPATQGALLPRGGPGGAGIGLALVYGYVSQLVFNIEAGARTEVVGLLDVRDDRLCRTSQVAALSIFEQHPSARRAAWNGS